MSMRGAFKDPTTKYDLVNRMMSRDFTGDLADLAVGRKLTLSRPKQHVLQLEFGDSGRTFELVVRKPRSEEALKAFRAKRSGKVGKTINTATKRGGRKAAKKDEPTAEGGEPEKKTGTAG